MNYVQVPESFHDLTYSYLDIPEMHINEDVFRIILHHVEFELDKILPRLENTIISAIQNAYIDGSHLSLIN